jgi:hypothetical protein
VCLKRSDSENTKEIVRSSFKPPLDDHTVKLQKLKATKMKCHQVS